MKVYFPISMYFVFWAQQGWSRMQTFWLWLLGSWWRARVLKTRLCRNHVKWLSVHSDPIWVLLRSSSLQKYLGQFRHAKGRTFHQGRVPPWNCRNAIDATFLVDTTLISYWGKGSETPKIFYFERVVLTYPFCPLRRITYNKTSSTKVFFAKVLAREHSHI